MRCACFYTYPTAVKEGSYQPKGDDKLFYETLKEVCERKNTTPSAVCVALGISKSNATEWKKGRSPKLDTVLRIAEYLAVSPSRLIPRQD